MDNGLCFTVLNLNSRFESWLEMPRGEYMQDIGMTFYSDLICNITKITSLSYSNPTNTRLKGKAQ